MALPRTLALLHLRATLTRSTNPGTVLAVGDTDPRAFHKNATFDIILNFSCPSRPLCLPRLGKRVQPCASLVCEHLNSCDIVVRWWCGWFGSWACRSRLCSCGSCCTGRLNGRSKIRIDREVGRKGGRKEDVGGVEGGGVDAVGEEEEGLEPLVEGRCWRRGMGSL